MELSRKAMAIADSVTLAIDAKAKAMAADGVDVVGFGAGEPDFNTPQFICDAAKKAIDEGKTRYTPVSGTLGLRKAICGKLARDNGLQYEPSQIVVSNGAKHSLFNTFQTLLNPGDEVIIPAPYWVSYPELVKIADGTPVLVPTSEENDFKMRIDALRAAVTPRTKALVLCNPCNPTGAMYDAEELRPIAELAVEKGFFVIADEIYEKLVYGGHTFTSIASLGEDIKRQTIVINGASKAFAMTGWRIGYTACEKPIAKLMSNLQSQATSNANSVAQYAMEAAMTQPCRELPMMVEEFDRRRLLLCDGINAIDGLSCRYPEGAFYVLMNITGVIGKTYRGEPITDSMAFARLLLEAYHVAVVPGVAFGCEGYVRLSYATGRERISEGLRRMAAFVRDLN